MRDRAVGGATRFVLHRREGALRDLAEPAWRRHETLICLICVNIRRHLMMQTPHTDWEGSPRSPCGIRRAYGAMTIEGVPIIDDGPA